MSSLDLEPYLLVSWTLMTLAVVSAAVMGKVCLGMLRAYYILRVRAGERSLHVYCCWFWVCLIEQLSVVFLDTAVRRLGVCIRSHSILDL